MFETPKEDPQLEQQWQLLEEYYHHNKPIVARLLGVTNGEMLADVGGIQGHIEQFVYAFTKQSSIETSLEETQSSIVQLAQQKLANLKEEIVLRIVEIDRKKNYLKLSQRLHPNEETILDRFEIGSIHIGVITSINSMLIQVDVDGVIGRLRSKQPIPNQPKILDLTTVLHPGQEIKVNILKNQDNSLLLSLEDLESYTV